MSEQHQVEVPSEEFGIAFRAGGDLFVTAADGAVQLWDTERAAMSGRQLDNVPGNATWAAFSGDGALIAIAGGDEVGVWGVECRCLQGSWAVPRTGRLAFNHDGTLLATSGGEITIWSMPDAGWGSVPLGVPLPDSEVAIAALAFHPSTNVLAGVDSEAKLRVWGVSDDAELLYAPVAGHTASVFDVDFSPDGRWIATSSQDGLVRLWEAATGETAGVLDGKLDWVRGVGFTADGSGLVSASAHYLALGLLTTVEPETDAHGAIRVWNELWSSEMACDLAADFLEPDQLLPYEVDSTQAVCRARVDR